MQDIKSFYSSRYQSAISKYEALNTKANKVSVLRLVYFLAWICSMILVVQIHWAVAIVVFYGGAYIFSRLMRWHDRVRRSATLADRTSKLCSEELHIYDLQLADRDTGANLSPDDHAYADDLDLFNEGGIYSLISRCRTSLGRQYLASALTTIPLRDVVDGRRSAGLHLEHKAEWMLQLQAHGYDIADSAEDLQQIRTWLEQPSELSTKSYLRYLIWVLPIITIAGFSWLWYHYTFIIALVALLPNLYLLLKTKTYVDNLQQRVDRLGSTMADYSHMFAFVESSDFTEPYIKSVTSCLRGERLASVGIARFSQLVNNINLRNNIFGIVINVFTLWDLHYGIKLEQWREQHKALMPAWYACLAELEVLVSIGSTNYHNPTWASPTWTTAHEIGGTALGHPLLDRAIRITNDYTTKGRRHVTLLTGSNMGGKSTFLRTVGLQIVLTYLGSRTCAEAWSMPYGVCLFTSMRTQDAIQESTSGFYAELRRLQQLIEAVQAGKPMYYLIDEVLKGTNSVDRNKGAAALIRQLVDYDSAGIVSTHDTTLHILSQELPGRVTNQCFEVNVEGDQLTFDYKLRDGVSKSFNATALMRQIGIKV